MKINFFFGNLLTSLLLLVSAFTAQAQYPDSATFHKSENYYWGGGHVGGGTYLINLGVDAGFLLQNKFVIAGKADWAYNFILFPNKSGQAISANEFSFMFGAKVTHMRYSSVFVLTGVSADEIKNKGTATYVSQPFLGYYAYDDDRVYHTIGVPVAVKLFLSPANHIAMDFTAAANFNGQRSFFSLTFGLAFGHLRNGVEKRPPGKPSHFPTLVTGQ